MQRMGFETQTREALTEWRSFRRGEQPFEIMERLCVHRGEHYLEIGPESYKAWSEGSYEWVIEVILDGQYFHTLRYAVSESILIGKSIHQIHQHMHSTFEGQLQAEMLQIGAPLTPESE